MGQDPNSTERARAAVALLAAAVLVAIAVVTLTGSTLGAGQMRGEPTPTLAVCGVGYDDETHQCSNDMPTGAWVLPPAPSPWP